MFTAMMLDMLAAIARKDHTDRRQVQGIERAKSQGKYRGDRTTLSATTRLSACYPKFSIEASQRHRLYAVSMRGLS
jgi:DNA invertase Pin-like site-specific DNA recombinase